MKDFKFCLLKDIYGSLLTDTQREMLSLYYEEDLSLFEIAEQKNVSRQAVRDSIKKAEAQLTHFEEKLGILKKQSEIAEKLNEVAYKLSDSGNNELSEQIKTIVSNMQV